MDSELPTELQESKGASNHPDVQERQVDSERSKTKDDASRADEEMRFVLSAERYLIGRDIRGLVHLENQRYGVVAWNDTKVYSLDRTKPDAVIEFNLP